VICGEPYVPGNHRLVCVVDGDDQGEHEGRQHVYAPLRALFDQVAAERRVTTSTAGSGR
jgi:hypothetical protein